VGVACSVTGKAGPSAPGPANNAELLNPGSETAKPHITRSPEPLAADTRPDQNVLLLHCISISILGRLECHVGVNRLGGPEKGVRATAYEMQNFGVTGNLTQAGYLATLLQRPAYTRDLTTRRQGALSRDLVRSILVAPAAICNQASW